MATVEEQLTEEQKRALEAVKSVEDAQKLTVQKKTIGAGSYPSTWWFHSRDSCLSAWWTPQRDIDLREFVKREGNDILVGAQSSIVKKFKAMNWTLEGPQATVTAMQQILGEADFGAGWSALIGKTVEDYTGTDRGAFWELIGEGDPAGPMEGLPVGVAHLDAVKCQLTGDPTWPVVYWTSDGPHKLHATRVVHMVDMESPNANMNGVGFCSVSRVVASSQVLLLVNKYKVERLEDLPPAGMLLLNNIVPQAWEDAQANFERGRRKLNQELWANIMVFLGVDPAQAATAEFVSFSQMPEHFDEEQTVNTYVNIVALSFGVDIREFWPVTSGRLGTSAESQVMHQKAKGKGVGDLVSTIERAVNWHVLPKRVTFRFDFQDDEEDQLRAEIEQTKIQSILAMYESDPARIGAADRDEVRQMLADYTEYFSEDFLLVDMSDQVIADDIDVEKHGPTVMVDRKGRVTTPRAWKARRYPFDPLYADILANGARGKVSLDDLERFVRLEREARGS